MDQVPAVFIESVKELLSISVEFTYTELHVPLLKIAKLRSAVWRNPLKARPLYLLTVYPLGSDEYIGYSLSIRDKRLIQIEDIEKNAMLYYLSIGWAQNRPPNEYIAFGEDRGYRRTKLNAQFMNALRRLLSRPFGMFHCYLRPEDDSDVVTRILPFLPKNCRSLEFQQGSEFAREFILETATLQNIVNLRISGSWHSDESFENLLLGLFLSTTAKRIEIKMEHCRGFNFSAFQVVLDRWIKDPDCYRWDSFFVHVPIDFHESLFEKYFRHVPSEKTYYGARILPSSGHLAVVCKTPFMSMFDSCYNLCSIDFVKPNSFEHGLYKNGYLGNVLFTGEYTF
ncbi:hypothetical protein QR680_007693 [Steinernema hermaphroditum]|uniref:Uncharacterized protein n=1 Tax=Steinernema hermaphroditum TaxID=289476 RepID=A0AA39M6D2_9BILA|nr:hypothetical protein QR680_007693 [Steinernema hermaphroditum]